MRISPSVGSVMRERSFSSVLLPAPLRPMMPTTSPRATSNEQSFSAQSASRSSRANGWRTACATRSASVVGRARWPM